MESQDKKFSHPTSYKGIKLGIGQRHYLARGKNRGVQAALKERHRSEALERAAYRKSVLASVLARIDAGALPAYKSTDPRKIRKYTTEYLEQLVRA